MENNPWLLHLENGKYTITITNNDTGAVWGKQIHVKDKHIDKDIIFSTEFGVSEHTHIYEKEYHSPTCTTDGWESEICECEDVKSFEILPAIGHSWTEWIIVQPSMGILPGERMHKCVMCSIEETEEYYATDHTHTFGDWVVTKQPTETEKGEKSRTCSGCGETETEDIYPTEGLEFTSNGDGTCYVSGIGTYNDANLTIPSISPDGDTVVSIAEYAFADCTSITNVIIPNSITSFGEGAFKGCSNIESITLPFIGPNSESVHAAFGYIFGGDEYFDVLKPQYKYVPASLKTVIITDETIIGRYAFRNCSNIERIILPETVTYIYQWSFANCTALNTIDIPKSVTTIDEHAFIECSSLEIVNYSGTEEDWSNVTIKSYNYPLNKATINYIDSSNEDSKTPSQGLEFTSNGDGTCYVSGIGTCTDTDIVIPSLSPKGDMVTSINYRAFYDCETVMSITIPNSVTNIGESAFSGCSLLKNITLGNNIINIGKRAFFGCENLTSITLPQNVTNIEDSAFDLCYKLVEIINNSSLEIISGSKGNGKIGYYAKIVHKGSTSIVNQNNYLFLCHENTNYLLGYIGTDTDLILPENYKGHNYEIYDCAFWEHSNLTSITIPDSVTHIGMGAFLGCSNLTSIIIPDSVSEIQQSAFEDCSRLTHVTISKGISNIERNVFRSCTNLSTITIPDSVTYIGERAFKNCTNLKTVYYTNTEEMWAKIDKSSYNEPILEAEIICNYVPEE